MLTYAIEILTSHWIELLVAFAVYYSCSLYVFDALRYKLPPGPFPLPFIGNLWILAKYSQFKGCLFKVFGKLSQTYGDVFIFYFGPNRFIILNEAKIIHETLVEQSKTYSGRIEKFLPGFEPVGEGIIFANGNVWKRNRRFGLKAMRDFGMGKEAMVSKVQEEASQLQSDFEKLAERQEPFFPRNRLANSVSNVVCSLIFGKRYDSPEDPQFAKLLHLLDDLLTVTTKPSVSFFFPFTKYFHTNYIIKKGFEMHYYILSIVEQAIKDHRQDFDSENVRDFADLFIQAEQTPDAISLDDFGWIMDDMFAAGTETTSTALSWTLLYLSKYPEIQRKCHEAIDTVIESNRPPVMSDRPKLVYLDAVFHEILRIAAVVPLSLFHSNLEVAGKIAGFDCPPYTTVVYNVHKVHHDASYWNNPDQFNPDRWIGEDGKLLSHSTHFMPFGTGPRICMGETLARVEYFIFLVSLLQRFKFELKTPNVNFDEGKVGFINACPEYQVVAMCR